MLGARFIYDGRAPKTQKKSKSQNKTSAGFAQTNPTSPETTKAPKFVVERITNEPSGTPSYKRAKSIYKVMTPRYMTEEKRYKLARQDTLDKQRHMFMEKEQNLARQARKTFHRYSRSLSRSSTASDKALDKIVEADESIKKAKKIPVTYQKAVDAIGIAARQRLEQMENRETRYDAMQAL